MVEVGQPFPEFKLQNQDGLLKTLKDYAGQWLVLYVYPKDDTPGCTLQGKSFTANKNQFETILKTRVVGLSADSVQSHKDFCNKFSFAIDLLADPQGEYISRLGVGQKEFNGQKYWNRTTFVIDDKGLLRKLYHNVNPEGHEHVLISDITAMKKGETSQG